MGSSSKAFRPCAGGVRFVVASISEESALLRRVSTGEETEEVFRRLRAAGAHLSKDRRLFLSLLGLGDLLLSLFLGLRLLPCFLGLGLSPRSFLS